MSKSFFPALASTLVLVLGSHAALAAQPQGTITGPSAKAMAAAQESYQAKRWTETIARSKEVLAIQGRAPLVTFAAYGYLAAAYQAQGNTPELINALKGQMDSGHPMGAPAQNATIKNIMVLSAGQKDYTQCVDYGNRLIRANADDASTYDVIADCLDRQGKRAEAIKFLQDYVSGSERAGQKPRESTLLTLRSLLDKQGNKVEATNVLEKLVTHYPKADYWNLLTFQLTRGAEMTDRQKLQVYRLKMATGTLKRCQDFSEMEEMAMANGMAGESQKVIEQATAAKVCAADPSGASRMERHYGTNKNVVNEEKAKFAKLESDARAARTGELDVQVGAQLFGNGEYAKAAEALGRGLGKGGLKDPADVQLTLATAQYRANDKAEAVKTLRAVKTNDAVTQQLVRLWLLYMR